MYVFYYMCVEMEEPEPEKEIVAQSDVKESPSFIQTCKDCAPAACNDVCQVLGSACCGITSILVIAALLRLLPIGIFAIAALMAKTAVGDTVYDENFDPYCVILAMGMLSVIHITITCGVCCLVPTSVLIGERPGRSAHCIEFRQLGAAYVVVVGTALPLVACALRALPVLFETTDHNRQIMYDQLLIDSTLSWSRYLLLWIMTRFGSDYIAIMSILVANIPLFVIPLCLRIRDCCIHLCNRYRRSYRALAQRESVGDIDMGDI